MKKCSISLSHQENANQNYTEIPSHPVRMAIIKKTMTNVGEDIGEK
jgi:hypothetical protein